MVHAAATNTLPIPDLAEILSFEDAVPPNMYLTTSDGQAGDVSVEVQAACATPQEIGVRARSILFNPNRPIKDAKWPKPLWSTTQHSAQHRTFV